MEVFDWLGPEATSRWAALGRGVFFFFFFDGGGYSSFFTYLYSSIRLMGHDNSVWGFGIF